MKRIGRVTSTGYSTGSGSAGYSARIQFDDADAYLDVKTGKLAILIISGVVYAADLARAPGSTAQLDLRSSPEGVVDLS